MPELHLRPQAEKDLRRMGPGPERARILAGLSRLSEDASNPDIKAIVGAPGWRRLRIGTYRVCYRSAPTVSSDADLTTAYVVARIVHRRDFDAAAMTLPAIDEP
ncbi:MAG: type II toxin-antitoxin system RelE/ParE family toxin [Actinobacteria bacterium]|nr:type II toxin-antitoxin system RelE/ParE family toxin [Actinomycetota bacterium]